MSLINQMLRDLDARQGPAGNAQLAALTGLGLVKPSDTRWQRPGFVGVWVLSAVLLLLGFQLHSSWNSAVHPHQANPPVVKDAWTALPLPEARPRSRGRVIPALGPPTDHSPVKTAEPVRQEAPRETIESKVSVADADTPARAANPGRNEDGAPDQAPAPATGIQTEPVRQPNPVRSLTPEEKAGRLFAQGQRALAAQHWRSAESLLQQTLDEWPGHLEARTQLASLLTSRQANDAAEQLLAQGLAIEPLAGELIKPYAQLLANRGALEAALKALEATVGNDTSDGELQALRGAILHRMGRHAEAAGSYEQALHEQPQQSVWWTGLAIAREHNSDPQGALRAYQRAAGLSLGDAVRDYVEQRIQALQPPKGY